MTELQKTARAVHDDFVADCIDKMETAAKEGKFSIEVTALPDHIKALKIYVDEHELQSQTLEHLGANTATIFINWGPIL